MPAREHDARQSVAEKFCTTVQVIFLNKFYCLKAVFSGKHCRNKTSKDSRWAFSTERRQLVKNIIVVACNGKTPPETTIEITGKFENSGTKIRQKSYYEMQTRKKTNGFFKRCFLQCKNFPKIVDRVKKQNYNVSNLSGR